MWYTKERVYPPKYIYNKMSRRPLEPSGLSSISPKRAAKKVHKSIVCKTHSKLLTLGVNRSTNPGRCEIKASVTDDRYESALHYAIYNKFYLPLDTNEDGNPISRPAMVNKADGDLRPLWSIADRDVGLDLFTIKFLSFHPIDSSIDGVGAKEQCSSHFESLRGREEDRNLVDVYRGSIFAYTAIGTIGRNRLPNIRVKQIYSPKIMLYKTYDELELLGNECVSHMAFQYGVEGTVIKVFKYKGQMCISTGSYIKSEYCTHLFSPDYKMLYYALGGPTEEMLFGAHSNQYDTNSNIYIFKIVHPATGQISRVPFKKCLVYMGVEKLKLDRMSGVDKVDHYTRNVSVRRVDYTDVIYNTGFENTMTEPVIINDIDYDQVLVMLHRSRQLLSKNTPLTEKDAIDDIMYVTGSWSVAKRDGTTEHYIAKFVSPQYQNLVISRGYTQNCMAQAINMAVLYSFVYTQNGIVLPGNDAIRTGAVIILFTYKGVYLIIKQAFAQVSGTNISYTGHDDADVFDIIRAAAIVSGNASRSAAIVQYMNALKTALEKMYHHAIGGEQFVSKKIKFTAQEFGSKLGSTGDFLFIEDANLSEAEAYLATTPSRYQIEKSGGSVTDVTLELSMEEYNAFKNNYIDFVNDLKKTRSNDIAPHNISLLYLRSKVTDNDRFTHRILDRKTDYLSAKKVLSYFLEAPL